MRQKLAIAATALVFAVAGVLVYQWRAGAFDSGPDPVAAGQRILAARLTGLEGAPLSLEQWRGKVLVVNFWATWCAPCREEIPEFIKLQSAHGPHGVQFVGIAVDTAERVAVYAKEMGINYPLLVGGLETMELAREVGDRAGVLPYSLVIDRSGRVVGTTVGILRPEKLEKMLLPLL
jgi:thiol-disulfide isomerase/thioredoxin